MTIRVEVMLEEDGVCAGGDEAARNIAIGLQPARRSSIMNPCLTGD